MNIKEMLYRDFGLDLMIAGGSGQSENDPIIVMATSYEEIAFTEMLLLRGLGKGRGILWRTINKTTKDMEDSWLEKVKLETKQVTQDKIITQLENYYFSVEKPTSATVPFPSAVDIKTDEDEYSMPYEIGWLHFDDLIDNEINAPGSGLTLFYGAPGIKATIYIYDNGFTDIPRGIDSPIVRDEFKKSIMGTTILNPKSEPVNDSGENGTFLIQNITQGDHQSLVALTTYHGAFVKIRITHAQDHLLAELVSETLSSFQNMLSDTGLSALNRQPLVPSASTRHAGGGD